MALLRVVGLGKTVWQGSRQVEILSDIDLCVERGEILALIGPTGSGKTTLLRLINLLDEPSRGSIIFDGERVSTLAEKEKVHVRRRMAMVFQKPMMFRGSVRDNISFGLRIRHKDGEKIKEALEVVDLSGYESRDAGTLSGGEAQRIALARALVCDPELLLLDEPCANLDPSSAASIDRVIEERANQRTAVIFSTHNMQQCTRLADRVAVLAGGRIAGVKSPDEILGC